MVGYMRVSLNNGTRNRQAEGNPGGIPAENGLNLMNW